MGHFETFQQHLFAGAFDRSVHLNNFDVDNFFRKLCKDRSVEISLSRLAANRAVGASSIGLLLADSLNGWHSPQQVNQFFSAFGFRTQFWSGDDQKRLSVLWQLRHSIVHTGGTLTLADAQKVPELNDLGDVNIVFEKGFISELARKLHPMVKSATGRIENAFIDGMKPDCPRDATNEIKKFFKVESSVQTWF